MRLALALAALCATAAARHAVETLFVGALGLAHDLAHLYKV